VPIVIEPQNRFNTNLIFTVMEGVEHRWVGSDWSRSWAMPSTQNIEISMTVPWLQAGRHLATSTSATATAGAGP
jgi:hypothetical protein